MMNFRIRGAQLVASPAGTACYEAALIGVEAGRASIAVPAAINR
jgi:hypothetical protein